MTLRPSYLALCFGVFIGCSSDPWSPVGRYEIIQVWQAGTCFLVNPRLLTLSIRATESEPPFEIVVAAPDVESELDVIASREDCTLSFKLVEPPGTTGDSFPLFGTASTVFNIVETNGNLEGAGRMTVGSPDSCAQNFTVEGSKE